jgi:hypothetical protein
MSVADGEVSDEERKELARLARNKATRTTLFTRERPTEWRPYQVQNVSDSAAYIPYFTDDSAWQFIADLLENGHPVIVKSLMTPPDAKGYEMHVPSGCHLPAIYIKIQFGVGCVIGRSFHYDE